tara:strand:- start:1923 stop:2615 length:693 start_codon:yes stop_codon:yes gene_type:complete
MSNVASDEVRYNWIDSLTSRPNLSPEQSEKLRVWICGEMSKYIGSRKTYLLKKIVKMYPSLVSAVMLDLAVIVQREELKILRREPGGTRCDCCDQYVKEYKRKVSKNMCVFLQSLVFLSMKSKSQGKGEYIHFKECDYHSHDYPYVVHWGLAERSEEEQGMYRPTDLGIKFAFGKCEIPKFIYTYNNHKTGTDKTEMVKITDVHSERFDLEEMLSSVVEESNVIELRASE